MGWGAYEYMKQSGLRAGKARALSHVQNVGGMDENLLGKQLD